MLTIQHTLLTVSILLICATNLNQLFQIRRLQNKIEQLERKIK